jgi:hypothetical protein
MARSCWARRPGPVEEVFDLSFREAAERRAGLVAVRTWSDPLIDIGSLRPEELRHWDRTEDRAQRELELAPWIVIHPEVSVEIMVVQDRPPTSCSPSATVPSCWSWAARRGARCSA